MIGRRVGGPGLQGGALGWVVGACGAGAAGSEIQPYLEGGIEEAALSGGRRVGRARGRQRYHRERRVGRPGLQGGGWLGEAALP